LHAQWEHFELTEGILYRKFWLNNQDGESWQLVSLVANRKEIMKTAYASVTGGHMGVKKTQVKVAKQAYWVGWSKDVRDFCRSCGVCAKDHRGATKKQGELQNMCVGAPWERAAIDITGPHPQSTKGNKFMKTVLDHFTKYAFAFPVRSHDAITVAKYLVERVFVVYGVPTQLLSGRGAEFEGSVMTEVCRLMEIDKIRTTAYKTSTNGALERVHRTLNTMLGKMVSEKQRDWDNHVAYVLAAYNATEHSATGYTPNMLVYGRELRFPNELMYADVGDDEVTLISSIPFVAERQALFQKAFTLTREMLGKAAERSKKRYDMRVKPTTYQVGDWVYYFCPRHRVGHSPKWQKIYSGLFLVTKILGSVNLRIQKSVRANQMVVHVDKVKQCMGETPVSWLGAEHYNVIPVMLETDVLTNMFGGVDRSGVSTSADDVETNVSARPKRNAGVPARFLSRVYVVWDDAPSNVCTVAINECVDNNNLCFLRDSEMKRTAKKQEFRTISNCIWLIRTSNSLTT